MFKKITFLLFAAIIVMIVPGSAIADKPTAAMSLNGNPLTFVDGSDPIITNGTTFVPLRELRRQRVILQTII